MRRTLGITVLMALAAGLCLGGYTLLAQGDEGGGEAADVASEMATDKEVTGEEVMEDEKTAPGFFDVVAGGGLLGVVLWLALLASSIAGVALIVDSFITIRTSRIMPDSLVFQIREAMEEGDVMKATRQCEQDPGAMANILLSGFSNVEEGFDVIQDAIGAAAELESEKLLQRVTYLSVLGNLSPMLGLLGTVQGMILAFAALAVETGAAQQSMLAMNISQALYTTAAGLCIAVPSLAFYHFFRNRANKIILNMELTTLDLVKALRNVEVVEE